MPRPPSAFALFPLLGVLGLVAACGGKGPATAVAPKPAAAIDADPYALLPPSAQVVARVEAKAVFTNPTIGADVSGLADSFVPLGDDAGFHASRDVERVVFATYATSNGDVAAVLVGHFDVDRMAHATKTKRSGTIIVEPHGTLTVYRSGRDAWAPVTPKTLVAGTPEGVTLVLDRIAKGALDRWEPPWMMSTLETPSTTVAVAADFGSRPLAAVAIGAFSLPWVGGIQRLQATGVLKPDALDVEGVLAYGNPDQARDAESGLHRSAQMLEVLGAVLGGVQLQGFSTKLDAQDVHASFGLDAQTLRTLLDLAPKLLPYLVK
jgi:hypothetical protein